MAWLKRYADEHLCEKPEIPRDARSGDIWQCDVCGAKFIIEDDQRDGKYFLPCPKFP